MQMDESTQQNAAMAEETSAVAASMASQAKELIQLISLFKIDERGQGGARQVHSHAYASTSDASNEEYRQVA
jgi:hypothetical protein